MGQKIKRSALIGYTGLVGQNIVREVARIDCLYNSKNIDDICGRTFELLICAGAKGSRRDVNENPDKDLSSIINLMDRLAIINAKKVVLISTVEVYNYHNGVNEDYNVNPDELPPYALHRFNLEVFCRERFSCLTIRLPIIFGVGLKKNIIFDLIHGQYNFTHKDNIFQFYDLANIWKDIRKALTIEATIVNLFSEPIHVCDIARDLFHVELSNTNEQLRQFDVRCKYWKEWDGVPEYLYRKTDIYRSLNYYIKNQIID